MRITATPLKFQCQTSYSPNHLLPTQFIHSGPLTPLGPVSICSSFPSPTCLKSMAQHYNPTLLYALNSFVALLHICLDKLYLWCMPTPKQLTLMTKTPLWWIGLSYIHNHQTYLDLQYNLPFTLRFSSQLSVLLF